MILAAPPIRERPQPEPATSQSSAPSTAQRRCDQRAAHSRNWHTVVELTAIRIVATGSPADSTHRDQRAFVRVNPNVIMHAIVAGRRAIPRQELRLQREVNADRKIRRKTDIRPCAGRRTSSRVSGGSLAWWGGGFGRTSAIGVVRFGAWYGFSDITILEKANGLGGTWFYNTYPGAACDVPSRLYSFSYATRRDWSRLCSPQAEILDYLSEVVRRHGVDRMIIYRIEVSSCTWDGATRRWTVAAADGRTWECDAVVVATGQLHRKRYPNIPGRDTFAGDQFHSAEWNHHYKLDGKRVAMVGKVG